MGKSTVKQMDEDIASELDLELCPFTLTIKHTLKLHRYMRGFIFAYSKDGITYYDEVPLVYEHNGLRIRVPQFAMHPSIRQRIAARHYQRWYMYSYDKVFPLQTAKPSVLEDSYPFKVNDDCLYRTRTAYTEGLMYLRKKPLVACRPIKPGWGVTLRRHQLELDTA
jgi:hypothetical protein